MVEDLVAGGFVDGGGADGDDGCGTFIYDVDEFRVADEGAFGGNGVVFDLEELFAVEEHHGGEVGDEVGVAEGGLGVERGNDAEGGEGAEVVVAFVDEREVGAFGA